MAEYDTGIIFQLLTEAFESVALWRLCRDTEVLLPVCVGVNRSAAISDIADAVIEHCRQQDIFDELLRAVASVRERQFKRFEPYLRLPHGGGWLVPSMTFDRRRDNRTIETWSCRIAHMKANFGPNIALNRPRKAALDA